MTKALLLAGALLLSALPAVAQSGPDDRDSPSDRGGRDPGSWRDSGRDGSWRDGSWRDGSWRGGGHGGWRDMRGEDRDFGGRRRGARFMVRSGDTAVAVRCDASESMRSCLDATLTLLERARGGSGGAGATSGSGVGPGGGPPRQ
jgi:hypothetical protein